jgi:hypothetical protein
MVSRKVDVLCVVLTFFPYGLREKTRAGWLSEDLTELACYGYVAGFLLTRSAMKLKGEGVAF